MGKIMITGGVGFVGSNLANLIKPSILFDWRKPGYLFKDQEESELIYDDCNFIQGDIRNPEDLEKCSKTNRINSIIHLAAIPGLRKCEEEPKLAREVNVEGTKNILEFARREDISKVIFASSAGVYGEIKEKPITETHPIDPLNLYSKTKVEGENLCKRYSEDYSLNTMVIRISNIYGSGFQVKSNLTVIPLFILRALQNQPLTVYGDGEQTRDFVHVGDVVQGYRKAFECSGSGFNVYNLGSGEMTSVNELADVIVELMEDLYDRDVEVKHVQNPEWRNEAKKKFDYSIGKISEDLGYDPRYTLREGIREILKRI